MNIEYKDIRSFPAIIFTDENGNTTICYNGNGGAVISHKDRATAERIWSDGMMLSQSVSQLLYFKQHGKFPDKANDPR